MSDSKTVWAKVRQLTGRSKTTFNESHSSAITADSLDRHYAEISTDARYMAPQSKCSVNTRHVSELIMERTVFNMLEALRPTATVSTIFLPVKVGALFFATPIADKFNLPLSTSVVPKQWKAASILPIPKILKPLTTADHRPISITAAISPSYGDNRCSR